MTLSEQHKVQFHVRLNAATIAFRRTRKVALLQRTRKVGDTDNTAVLTHPSQLYYDCGCSSCTDQRNFHQLRLRRNYHPRRKVDNYIIEYRNKRATNDCVDPCLAAYSLFTALQRYSSAFEVTTLRRCRISIIAIVVVVVVFVVIL